MKDERHFDRFDRVFAAHFKGAEELFEALLARIPAGLAAAHGRAHADRGGEGADRGARRLGQADGDAASKRLEEQKGRHQGGNKWIGTGGTSPFGAYGYNPEGIRIGQDESRNRRAVKVWDQREFRNLDDTVELGTRNIKIALRELRRFAREGAADQLDLDGTIDSTARNAGLLDLKYGAGAAQRGEGAAVPRRRRLDGRSRARLRGAVLGGAQRVQAPRVFLLPQLRLRERVEGQPPPPRRDASPTLEVMRTYGHDYKLIFVGDATMSPYEIVQPGGSIEHWNEEAGRGLDAAAARAPGRATRGSIRSRSSAGSTRPRCSITRELLEDRMFPLTLGGLDQAIKALALTSRAEARPAAIP